MPMNLKVQLGQKRLADYKSEGPVMSKQMGRLLRLVALFGLATTVFVTGPVVAVVPKNTGVAASTARNAAIIATSVAVLKETSELRELSILRPVKSGAQSRAEIERMIVKNLDEQTTPAEMHATELTLKKLGLAPADFQYRPFIVKLLTEQVAGYYDPKAQQFYLADWIDLEGQKPVMAHELTHALQDQHFNLRRFENWPKGDSDAELAVHALIEGDATLAMTLYMAKNPLVALAFSRSLTTGVATEQFNQAPRAIRESLIFPYMQGMEWATQLYRRGGWTMVSNAFTRLPLSSEQIIHPEKYFNYERPIKIALPDVTNLLNAGKTADGRQQIADSNQQTAVGRQQADGATGASSAPGRAKISSRRSTVHPQLPAAHLPLPTAHRSLPTAQGPLPTAAWHRIDSDVNGEWTYYLILDQFFNSPAESKRAAAGWGGDRYAIYEGPNDEVFLAQIAAWDTENDAREFFDAYVKRTELRYPGAKRLDSTTQKLETRSPKPETGNLYSWETSEGGVIVELRGQRVVILEGIPAGVESETLLKSLRQ